MQEVFQSVRDKEQVSLPPENLLAVVIFMINHLIVKKRKEKNMLFIFFVKARLAIIILQMVLINVEILQWYTYIHLKSEHFHSIGR